MNNSITHSYSFAPSFPLPLPLLFLYLIHSFVCSLFTPQQIPSNSNITVTLCLLDLFFLFFSLILFFFCVHIYLNSNQFTVGFLFFYINLHIIYSDNYKPVTVKIKKKCLQKICIKNINTQIARDVLCPFYVCTSMNMKWTSIGCPVLDINACVQKTNSWGNIYCHCDTFFKIN